MNERTGTDAYSRLRSESGISPVTRQAADGYLRTQTSKTKIAVGNPPKSHCQFEEHDTVIATEIVTNQVEVHRSWVHSLTATSRMGVLQDLSYCTGNRW